MDNFYDISLIIPVYNVQNYLSKALASVENQTFKNFEVIIVNDGSTDDSPNIIREFVARNKNFRVIHQKNKGLGEARNTGLKATSNSKYIAFMDSDDFLECDYLKKMYETALKYDADIVCCNFNFYFPSSKIKVYWPFTSPPGVYSGENALKKVTSCIGIFMFVWTKFFKKELFTKHKIKFYDMYYEDSAISPRLFYYSKRVVIIPDVLYNYVMRDTSILHTMNAEKVNDSIKALGVMREFYETKGIYSKLKRRMRGYAKRFMLISYYNVFMMHFRFLNFEGLIKNLKAVDKSINHFISEDYSSEISFKLFDSPPSIPFEVVNPSKKTKTK